MASYKRKIKDNKGFTLVEILSVIVILSIVSLFLLNIALSSTKQGNSQTKESIQINDTAYLLKQITKDLRTKNEVEIIGDKYTFKKKDDSNPIVYIYEGNNKILYRSGEKIGFNLENFGIKDIGNNTVKVFFKINNQEYETSVALRKGEF